jgi:hypothetical protein
MFLNINTMMLIYNQVAVSRDSPNHHLQHVNSKFLRLTFSSLCSSNNEHEPSKPPFGQKDQFSDHLQSLLSWLADSLDKNDSESSSESG